MNDHQVNLGDIISLEYGKPLPDSDRSSTGIPAYGANGILCWSTKAYRELPSIIVGRKGSAGEVNLTDGPFWPTDVTYFVEHERSQTELKYLFHLLKHLNLPRLAKGVKPGINRNDVYAIKVPCPPLPEQKRIVAILDEAFEGIDKAIANTEKNLANVKITFDRYLDLVFGSIEGPTTTLEQALSEQPRNGWSPPAEHHSAEGTPVLTLSSVTGFRFRPDKIKHSSAPTSSDAHYWVRNGDC